MCANGAHYYTRDANGVWHCTDCPESFTNSPTRVA